MNPRLLADYPDIMEALASCRYRFQRISAAETVSPYPSERFIPFIIIQKVCSLFTCELGTWKDRQHHFSTRMLLNFLNLGQKRSLVLPKLLKNGGL